jgi:hypothetical protein
VADLKRWAKSIMRILLLIFLLVVSLAPLRADTLSPEKIYGGDFVAMVRSATRVEAQRVTSEYARSKDGSKALKVTPKGDSIRLSAESMALLKRAFLKESEADLATKFCMPTPGIRYIFHSPDGSISILVCYHCQIALVERDGRVSEDESYVDHVIAELRKVAGSFLSGDELAKLP